MTDPTSENRIETVPVKARGHLFPKGVSGNPGSRPKGLRSRIREATNDGHDLVDYVVGVFTDESAPTKMRMEAATWLGLREAHSSAGGGTPTTTAGAP